MVGRWLFGQLFLVAVILLQCSTTIDGSKCTDSNVHDYVNGNCIYVSRTPVSFEAAIAVCQARNRYPLNWSLVKVDTRRKFERLVEITRRSNVFVFWIGLRRDNPTTKEEKQPDQWRNWAKWRWIRDGSTLDASFVREVAPWQTNEPNNDQNANERCGMQSFGKWNDAPCNVDRSLMCESIDVSTTTRTTRTTPTTRTTKPTSTTKKPTTRSTTSPTTTTKPTTRSTTTTPTSTTTKPASSSTTISSAEKSTISAMAHSTAISSNETKKRSPEEDSTSFYIGLGVGIGSIVIALILITILFFVVYAVRRKQKRRRVINCDMSTSGLFSAMSDESAIFRECAVRRKGKKKGGTSSTKSSKREPPKKKGPSAADALKKPEIGSSSKKIGIEKAPKKKP